MVMQIEAIWLLAILACPLLMGAMMFLMMRGMRRGDAAAKHTEKDAR